MNLDKAIHLAWSLRDGVEREEPAPTAQEAYDILVNHKPTFNWLTRQAAIDLLAQHLGVTA